MAKEEKEKAVKAAKPKKEKKSRDNIFKGMVSELKKVTWPTRKELTSYCISVFVFVIIMAIAVAIMDIGSTAFINLLTDTVPGLF